MGLSVNGLGLTPLSGRQVGDAAQRVQASQERLASLLRINRASDDAAGLSIAERFRTEVLQFETELRGFQSGLNLAQTAEGGLESQSDVVGRVRELALQAANETLTTEQRAALNSETQGLIGQLDDVAQQTEFNGIRPLDGSTSAVTLDAEGDVALEFEESTSASLGLDSVDLSTAAGAQAALAAADSAQASINTNRANIGAQVNRVSSAFETRAIASENAQAAESALRDLDVAREFIEQTRNEVLLQGGLAALAQGNLNNRTASLLLGN